MSRSQKQAIQRLAEDADYGRSAFGEVSISEMRPFVQATAAYNLIPANFREYTFGSGTTGCEDKMFKVTTGTSSGGYGAIQSFRSLNYKAGEGGLVRFSAKFPTNVASSWQGVGLVNLSDELSFGYNGTAFGIWHRYGGYAEVRTITVSGGAGGSENLTLTLNGTGFTIPLTSGTTEHNAYEIAAWINTDATASALWYADQVDSIVIISSKSDGAKSGSYSFSSSTATGSIAQTTAGVTKTSDHIPQSEWSEDRASWLDPTKLNVYQIRYQYLGAGNIFFFVEDPETGRFKHVHSIEYANANTTPSLTNPSLHVGLYCVSLGSTTDLSVYCASIGAFMEGQEGRTRNPRARQATQTVTTSYTNVLSLRNRRTYNGYVNQQEIEPQFITVANESTKNAVVQIIGNTTMSGDTNFTAAGTNLLSDYDTTANTVSGGRLLASFSVAGGDSAQVDLSALRIRVPPTLTLTVAARVTSGASASVTAALTWYEDI